MALASLRTDSLVGQSVTLAGPKAWTVSEVGAPPAPLYLVSTVVGGGEQGSVHLFMVFEPIMWLLKMLLSWSGLAKDRESWKDKIQQILGHTQQTAGNV